MHLSEPSLNVKGNLIPQTRIPFQNQDQDLAKVFPPWVGVAKGQSY